MSIDEMPADPEDLEKVRTYCEERGVELTPLQEQILAKILHLYNHGYILHHIIPRDGYPYFAFDIMTDQERSSYG